MAFIKAFAGAIGGMFADQWLDFLTAPPGVTPTTALVPAQPQGRNRDRGENTKGSDAIISNGSRIVVPQGFGLLHPPGRGCL